ncbi:hypothetical protein SLS53_009052 [Cytospora paraplurivora]|uniref:Annexin n=1 Tax=Cytospora paraplurivora TaxID=2898453 RepID=A0AAN9TVZ7_9PEZI
MPPYGATPQYGAPMSSYPTPCSPGYERPPRQINWDANPTANALRKAMKGFGTDEKALIREIADKDPYQIRAINDAYRTSHRRNLVPDIEGETSGWFRYGLVQLARGPLMADVYMLHESIDGPGTKELVINDVLLGRSNADINALKEAYKETFRRTLEADVQGDLSCKTKRHFEIVLGAKRAEDSAPVIGAEIERDVDALYGATEGKLGTDEIRVCSILSTRNDNQIRAIADAYHRRYARNLETVISSEFSGHMQKALLYQLRQGVNKSDHQLQLIRETMDGFGTKDYLLVSRVVRLHWDRGLLDMVKRRHVELNRGQTLGQRIKKDVRASDYQRLMIACIGDPQ